MYVWLKFFFFIVTTVKEARANRGIFLNLLVELISTVAPQTKPGICP